MKPWKLWIGILLVFLLGGGVGSLGTGYVLQERSHRFLRSPSERTRFIVEKLTRKLALSNTQKAEVEAIVQKTQEKSRPRFLSHRAEMESILNEGVIEIRKCLTPQQQEKMDQLHNAFTRKRMMREGSNRGFKP